MKDSRNGSKMLSIPAWAIGTVRFLGPVVAAVAIFYARLVSIEGRVTNNEQHEKAVDAKIEANEIVVGAMDRRLNTQELKQQVLEKDLSASLARIELTIKDIQID